MRLVAVDVTRRYKEAQQPLELFISGFDINTKQNIKLNIPPQKCVVNIERVRNLEVLKVKYGEESSSLPALFFKYGDAVGIFDSEEECTEFYRTAVARCLSSVEELKSKAVQRVGHLLSTINNIKKHLI